MFSEKILKQYKTLCRSYPKDDDLKRRYFSHLEWMEFKTSMRDNVQIEKINKVKDFDHQLRLPLLRLSPLKCLTSSFTAVDILYPNKKTKHKSVNFNEAKKNESSISKALEFAKLDIELIKKEAMIMTKASHKEFMKYIVPKHRIRLKEVKTIDSTSNQKLSFGSNELKIEKTSDYCIESLTNRTYLSTDASSYMSKDKAERQNEAQTTRVGGDIEAPYNEFQNIFDVHVKRIFSNITERASKIS